MTNKDLLSHLDPELFIPELKARSKNDAIQKMVAHLEQAQRISNSKIVLEALKTREKLGSTGIGKGIAIPHTRSTVTGKLTVLFARSTKGIEFSALDKKPVHLFFMILAPHKEKGNEYLPLLGKIVEVTKDANVRRKLLKAPDFDSIPAALTRSSKAKAK